MNKSARHFYNTMKHRLIVGLATLLLWNEAFVSSTTASSSSTKRSSIRRRLKKGSSSAHHVVKTKAGKEQLLHSKLQTQHKLDDTDSQDGGYTYHSYETPIQQQEEEEVVDEMVSPSPRPSRADSVAELIITPTAAPVTTIASHDETTTASAATASETSSYKCNMSSTQYKSALRQLLLTITPPEILDTNDSPQAKALQWLVYEDTIEPPLCPPPLGSSNGNDDSTTTATTAETILQRYIMTSFYYATNGDNWKECRAPSSSLTTNYNNECSIKITTQSNVVLSFIIEQAFSPTNEAEHSSRKIGTNSWLTPTDTCDWAGLACSYTTTSTTNHYYYAIDHLELENNNLSGTLLPELSTLYHLKFLILEKGQLYGPIPPLYGQLVNLRVLDMDYNDLSGSIPSELYDLVELRELDLNDNRLSGTIWGEGVGRLVNLVYLQLDGNELVGGVPEEVGGLKELAWAVFHGNNLSGEMPASVCENSEKSDPPGKIALLTADCYEGGPVVCSCCDYCGGGQ